MELAISFAVFLTVFLFIQGSYFLFRTRRSPEVKRIREELKALSNDEDSEVDILRKGHLSNIPWLHRILSGIRTPVMEKLNRLLRQADAKSPLGVFVLLTLVLGSSGFFIAGRLTGFYVLGLLPGLALGSIPLLYLLNRKRCRMKKFESRLPDALDLIARALKAGHGFTSGLQMVSKEFSDPLGKEFGQTLDEINFGANLKDALKNLTERVDCPDLKFFAVSVIIQRQSGGNLAEIMENISRLIRERFKLRRHIRALTSETRLSAFILMLLPFIFSGALLLINPDYVKVLVTDPVGRMLSAVSFTMMCCGMLVMKRMTIIRV